MEDKRKLYDGLVSKGLYTKSYEEFVAKYSSEENISKMYNSLFKKGMYTKDESLLILNTFLI